MPFAVEMLFDAASEKRIRDIWTRLREKNISSSMLTSGSRPHITLSIFDSLEISEFGEKLEMFVEMLDPLDLTFTGVGSFSGVLYLAPAVTEDLSRVHGDFNRVFAPYRSAMWQHDRPGTWVPHCPLARELPEESLSRAMACVLEGFTVIRARTEEIGLVEFPPVKYLASYNMREGR